MKYSIRDFHDNVEFLDWFRGHECEDAKAHLCWLVARLISQTADDMEAISASMDEMHWN